MFDFQTRAKHIAIQLEHSKHRRNEGIRQASTTKTQKKPLQIQRFFYIIRQNDNVRWWWGGTLRQIYVTQRLRTAANSSGKVQNPAPTANNPTSSARPRSSAKCLSQDASSIPVCGIEPTSATPDRLAWHHSAEPAPGRTACFRSKRRKNASIRSADPWPVSSLAPKR